MSVYFCVHLVFLYLLQGGNQQASPLWIVILIKEVVLQLGRLHGCCGALGRDAARPTPRFLGLH